MEWQRDAAFGVQTAQKVRHSRYVGGDAEEDCSRIDRSGSTRYGPSITPVVDRYMWVFPPLSGFLVVLVVFGCMNCLSSQR